MTPKNISMEQIFLIVQKYNRKKIMYYDSKCTEIKQNNNFKLVLCAIVKIVMWTNGMMGTI